MRTRALAAVALLAVLGLAGCGDKTAPAAQNVAATAPAETTTTAAPGTAPAVAAAPAAFSVDSVPESTASLPPFPMFAVPEGLTSVQDAAKKNVGFDREHFIAGDKIVPVEGKIFNDTFNLESADGRRYSGIEFQRNYQNAVQTLGGVEISKVQFTPAVVDAFGGREAVEAHYAGICVSDGCETHTYLVRKGGKEYWIEVSSGGIPLHGHVVVLERQGMTQSLGFLNADQMKSALDANGHVALYINFDTDKATIRPDGRPVVDEIVKLLKGSPALKLSVEGHTDNTGAAEHNRTLSADRARSVMQAVVTGGVEAGRLSARGFGADKPLADNGSENGRAKNRRVELVKVS
ncbi:MAG: OmpA family protein [Caulobacteraceae bacterium]